MFRIDEYRREMQILNAFGFKQNPKLLNAFHKSIEFDVVSQVMEDDDQHETFSCMITLHIGDAIVIRYNKFAALESGRLIRIECVTTCAQNAEDLLKSLTGLIGELVLTPTYDIESIPDEYSPMTSVEIVKSGLTNK